MGEELEPSEQQLERTWKHPGLRADIKAVLGILSPQRAAVVLEWLDSWHVHDEDRGRTAFEAATEEAGTSADELLDAIMADERLTDLFRMTMELAARSGSEQKLKALGKALASGVLANDDAAYEQSLLLMRTIGQLEAPDIRVLSLVQHFERVHPTAAKDEDVWAGLSAGPFPPLAVWVHLEQTGLIRKVPGSGEDQPYYLTDYGKQVVEELVTAGQAD
jgi:hypothetical protein